MTSPVLLVGIGAVSCFLAARFAAADIPFQILANWPEGYAVLKTNGVTLIDAVGEEARYPVKVINASELVEPVRDALILVKSWQTERSARQVAWVLTENGTALTLQNGIDNRDVLAGVLGWNRVSAGINEYGATLLDAGVVKAAGTGRIVLDNSKQSERLYRMLDKAGLAVEASPDISSLIWQKLLINAVINPLATLFEVPNGSLLDSLRLQAIMSMLCWEIVGLYECMGITLPSVDPFAEINKVIEGTRTNYCSMLQDYQRGTKPELDQITGALIKQAKVHGFSMPYNAMMYEIMQEKFALKLPAVTDR